MEISFSDIAMAMASPSVGEVPRPSSSIITRLFFVARLERLSSHTRNREKSQYASYLKIIFISSISTAKVPKLRSGLSSVDKRVKSLSHRGTDANRAGTKQPICASI